MTRSKIARFAHVLGLAREGWHVCFSYLANEATSETMALAEKAGGKALAVQADVAKQQDVRRLFAESQKAFGRLDALVNNAGVVGGTRSIFDADAEHLRGVFDANVLGSFYCACEAAKRMSTQRRWRSWRPRCPWRASAAPTKWPAW